MVSRNDAHLIEAFYDAALGHQSWTEVSQQVASSVGGFTLMLAVHHPNSPAVDIVTTQGMTPQSIYEYGTIFAQHDLWALGALKRRILNRTLTSSDILDERELTRSFIYNEYLKPKVNVHHLAGCLLGLDGGYFATFGIHRPRDAKDYRLDEVQRIDGLLPHLRRALEMRRRLQQAEQTNRSVFSALDRLSIGILMMSATGRILHANTAGEVILRDGDGLVRTAEGFRAAWKDDDKRLQDLIVGLRSGGDIQAAGGHLRIRRPSGRQAYAVMLAPMRHGVSGREHATPAILVFVSDPGAKFVSDLAILTELFGFPSAEGRLVLALLSGVTPPEFARTAGVTYNTVRTLLARAMARTETRSQLEMVLLVASAIGGTVGPQS